MINTTGVSLGSMPLDTYSGSAEQAIANLHVGRNQGYAKGVDEGYEEGYGIGFANGHNVGWDAGIAAGNVETMKANAYIEQYSQDKKALSAALAEQQQQILNLEAKLKQIEEENRLLRGTSDNSSLLSLVDSLKTANLRLQENVTALNEQLREKTAQYNERMWQYNRAVVFMNAVRGVLDEITSTKNEDADKVRAMFVEKYNAEVGESIEGGHIKLAPHVDQNFAKALPRTNQFILQMLDSVKKEIYLDKDEEPSESWLMESSIS